MYPHSLPLSLSIILNYIPILIQSPSVPLADGSMTLPHHPLQQTGFQYAPRPFAADRGQADIRELMGIQANAMSGPVCEVRSIPLIGYDVPGNPVDFRTCNAWSDGGRCLQVSLQDNVINLLHFGRDFLIKNSACLVGTIMSIGRAQIKHDAVTGSQPGIIRYMPHILQTAHNACGIVPVH